MSVAAPSQRTRLLGALAASIGEKGYGATTIADVVGRARVSKRAFYEHFSSKEECFTELALAATDSVLAEVEAAVAADAPWPERVELAARAYLERLAAEPGLARTYFVEAPPQLRREAYRRYTRLLIDVSQRAANEDPRVRPIAPDMATAVVGGVNELLLEALEDGRAEAITSLVGTATALIRAVATRP